MNGSIKVRSEKGKGSEFIVSFAFRLCLDAKELKKNRNLPSEEQMLEQEDLRSQPKRILLAEDVEMNQEIAVAILEDAGFMVDVAGNGKIAVEILKKAEPEYYQAVLMDVQMPVMNGYEATKEIRSLKNRRLASIPIIAMTANAFEEDRQEAMHYGMNGHIAKPIDVQNLFETLESVL